MQTRTYDCVIVGAGTAGCVLANRLSACAGMSVLLIEAGSADRSQWIHVPGGIFKLIHNPALDWCFETEAEPGLNDRKLRWPRGKVLGGSSSINGMVYIRGQREDFDTWRDLGNPGWSYADVLPYFRRSEDQARGADEFHGSGGPMAVSDPRFKFDIVDAFIAAAQQVGVPRNVDFNGARQEGVGYFQLNVRNGRRCSAARAFLKPVRRRANLTVITDALVHRVLMSGRKAVGVEYSRGGTVYQALCNAEVILSAGAVGSPQLLQLSGIGDPSRLRALGIEPVHALDGVGRNLQDHFQAKAIYKTTGCTTLNDQARTFVRRMLIGADYALRRQGPLSFGASLAGAFAKSDPRLSRADLQFHFQPLSLDSYDGGLHPFSAFTMHVCQLRPASRGEIVLKSADPREPPLIRANYLSAAEDRATMIEAIRLARRIAAAPALAAYVASEWKPGPDVTSDDEVLDYVRRIGNTVFHPAGGCCMGPGAEAVVDAQLRVHGIAGLRVVDCSIMPTIVSGNTNAAAMMIGEKGADLILAATAGRAGQGTALHRAS